jgi:hypothetical protein
MNKRKLRKPEVMTGRLENGYLGFCMQTKRRYSVGHSSATTRDETWGQMWGSKEKRQSQSAYLVQTAIIRSEYI